MAKEHEMRSRFGANMAESMGANRTARNGAGGVAVEEKPDRSDGTERLRSAVKINMDRISHDPEQPRTHFDEEAIDRLAASITEHGQIQPISVRWSDDLNRYLIVAGERRYRASVRAGRKTIDANIIENQDPSKILEIQLIENCLREDLQPVEQARAFRRLMDRNEWSALRLGQTLKISESTILKTLALLTLPCTVQDRVEAGEIAPSVAYEIAKLDDATDQQVLADRVVTEGLNRSETVEAVRRVAQSKPTGGETKGKGGASKTKAKLKTSRTLKASEGYRITVERTKGVELAGLAAALSEALEEIKAELTRAA